MAQQLIDFGSFPDDPTADAIRIAFQKTQQNFAELYSGSAGQAVYSVNRTPGAGITVNAPVGNVVVTANIACVQVETSTLSIGITANGGQNAVYTQSNQVLVIDLPNEVINIKDITISGNLTANRVTANNDMYTGTLSATGNANVANLNSANNVTGTNLTITNGMMSGNLTLGNLTMVGNVKSHLLPTPTNTLNLGSSSQNWNVLYTQDIVLSGTPVSGIGKVVPSFGNVYLPSNVTVSGTTSGTATTLLTFTFPNSGYYRVNTVLIAEPASTGTPPITYALFDDTGTLVPNSEIMLTTATGGISQTLTSGGVIDIQVGGAVSYTVRAWGTNSPSIVTYGSNGRSSVNWLKLDPPATISTTGNVTYGNLTVTGDTQLNTLSTSGNANIADLNVAGNAIISGNLTVDGNIVYVNVEDLSVEDPIIQLQTGPNGSPLVADTGKDVGIALNYFTTSPKVAWMGWDNSASEITLGEDVTISSEVVSYTKLANVRAGNFIGTMANGSSNIQILLNANINFAVEGNGNRIEIGNANTYVNNQLWANSNVYIKNTGALVFQDDEGGNLLDTYIQYNNSNNTIVMYVNSSNVMESNISNTFFNSPLTANANLIIPNGNRIIFVDDLSTTTDTGISYDNTSDSLIISVNGSETIKSNVANTTLTGNVIISGNLAVDGNITYINTETLAIEDPIIQLQTGPNGAAPTSNSGKDIGTALNYYDSAARVAFMGWDVTGQEFGFASRATITNEVVAFDVYGNIRAGNVIARLANGTSNIYIEQNGPILFSAQGSSNIVNIAATITHVNNQLYANNNMYINNSGSGAFLYFIDDVNPNNDSYIAYENTSDSLRMFVNGSEKFNLNSAGANVLNGNLTVQGDATIQGGDLLTNQLGFNLLPTTAETVTLGLAATSIEIGAASGTTNINNNLDVDGDILMDGGDFNVSTSTANLMEGNANVINAFGSANTLNMGSTSGVILLRNPTLVGSQTTQNVYNTIANTVNAFGAGNVVNIGKDEGTMTLRNPTLVGANVTQNVYNSVATTVNAFGAGNVVNIGKDEGTMTLRNPTIIGANATQNLFNTVATTVNFAGEGTNVNIASSTGNTTVKNNLVVNGNLTVDQDIIFSGCDIDANCVTLNVFNNIPQTINLGANASTLNIGNTTGTATLRNPTLVGTETTQNVYNTTATTVNAFGAAATLNVGVDFGTITLRNPTLVGANATQNLYNTVASTIYFGGSATNVFIGNTGGLTTFGGALLLNDANTAAINFKDANGSPLDTAIYYNNSSDNYGISLNGQDKIEIFNSNTTIHSNLIVDFDLAVNGGDITSNQATFNLLNSTPSTINFGANASSINIGNTTGTATLRNPTLVGTETTQNVYNTTATTVNAFGTAATLNIGNTTGTATLRNPTLVGTETTQNVYNTTATTVNAFGAAATLNVGVDSGTVTLRNPTLVGANVTQNVYNTTATTVNAFGAAATLNIGVDSGTATLRNPTLVGANVTQNVYDTVATTVNAFGLAATLNMGATTGTATLRNPTLVGTQSTQNVYDSVATTVNAFGVASTLNLGATSGTATLRNPTLVGTQSTQNVYDTVATTMNFAGAATTVNTGAAGGGGTFTIRNDNVVMNGDLQIQGGDLTTTAATFNLLNATATTINFGGAATTLEIGAASGTTNINNNLDVDGNTLVNGNLQVDQNATVTGDLAVNGGDLTTTSASFNLVNATATTVNVAGAGTTVGIGAATGNTTINNNLVVKGNITLDADIILAGCDLITDCTTFNLINTNATTVNFAGAATTLNMGASGATVTMPGNVYIDQSLAFNAPTWTSGFFYQAASPGPEAMVTQVAGSPKLEVQAAAVVSLVNVEIRSSDFIANSATFNLANTIATTINFAGNATALNVGAATGNTTINHNLIANGNIETVLTTLNLANANSTTINFGGAGTQINVGASTGNTQINNNLIANGNVETVLATLNLANANSTTVNFAGAGTAINIGAATGNTTINHNLIANGNIETKLTTLNLANANSTTINFGGAGTNVNIGASTGNTTVNNNLIVKGNIELDADLILKGCDFNTNCTSFNLVNANATTVYFAGAGTTVEIGAATGNTNINNNLDVDGNLNIDGTSLTVTQATFNLANANATTINFGGAATNVVIGATGATTKIPGNVYIDHSLGFGAPTWTSGIFYQPTGPEAMVITVASAARLEVTNAQVVANANLSVTGSNLLSTSSTFSICDAATTSTLNLGRGASQLNLGAASSNSAFGGSVYVTGNININGGNISGPSTLIVGSTSSNIQIGTNGGLVAMNGDANVAGNVNATGNLRAYNSIKAGAIDLVASNGFIYTNANIQGDILRGMTSIKAGAIDLVVSNGFIYTNGDISANNISAGGLAILSSNGLITGTSITTGPAAMYSNGTIQASLFSGNGASLTSLTGTNVTGKVANAVYADSAGSASTATSATSATSAGFATNAGYATSAGSAGFASCAGALVGSGCDVAEFYAADDEYEVGTVLEFGGDYDVTLSSKYDSHKVAGVISTEPGVTLGEYVEFDSDNRALLALVGRVPTKVIGPVEKGDLMVSAPDGYAIANNMARAGTIIGKSLENFYGDRGVIDIVVGRH